MRHHARTGGHTLVELMIVVAVLVAIAAAATGLVVQSNESQRFARDMNHATELGQKLVGQLEREMSTSAALYANDPLGNAYRAILELPATPPPLDSTTLPTIDVTGHFERESTSGSKSGNALLFARHAWTTDFRCTSGNEYRIDVYRMVFYYLGRVGKGPRPGSTSGVTLCRFVSEPMADADQVDAISDAVDLSELLAHLAGETPGINGRTYDEIQLVWHRYGEPTETDTFRQIDQATGTLSSTPVAPRTAPWRLNPDPRSTTVRMLSSRHFGIATNHAPPSFGVGAFSVIDDSGDGFPHGFEVQVIGESFIRQVLVNLVIAGTRPGGPTAYLRTRSQSMLPVR